MQRADIENIRLVVEGWRVEVGGWRVEGEEYS